MFEGHAKALEERKNAKEKGKKRKRDEVDEGEKRPIEVVLLIDEDKAEVCGRATIKSCVGDWIKHMCSL